MRKGSLNLFFDQACAVSVYIMIFFIPISTGALESLFGFSLLFFLGRLFTRRGLLSEIFRREKIILLFFVSLAVSLFNSRIFLSTSLLALFLKWGEYIIMYLIVSQTFTDKRRIDQALAMFVFSAALVFLDCYSQLFFKLEFLLLREMALYGNNIPALTGPFPHNNDLAAYLICAFFIIMYWVFSGRDRRSRIASGLILSAGIILLPFTYSRGSYLSFIAGTVLLLFLVRKPLILSALLIATLISGLKFSLLKSIAFKDAGRFELWGISLRMIREHPLIGNGIGTFMSWFRNFSPAGDIKYAHNCFLQLWAEAGFIALALFVLFVLNTLHKGSSVYKTTKDSAFLFLCCAVVAYLINCLFDNSLFSLHLAALFWVLMGLLKGYISSAGSQGCA